VRVHCVKTVERRNFLWKGTEKLDFYSSSVEDWREKLAGCARLTAEGGGRYANRAVQ
jgi:hypothetical protein